MGKENGWGGGEGFLQFQPVTQWKLKIPEVGNALNTLPYPTAWPTSRAQNAPPASSWPSHSTGLSNGSTENLVYLLNAVPRVGTEWLYEYSPFTRALNAPHTDGPYSVHNTLAAECSQAARSSRGITARITARGRSKRRI